MKYRRKAKVFETGFCGMYPNITMPQEDNQNLNDVLTTMATGAIPADSEVQDYTASEDIMDISSYAPPITTTYQHAIPTSVITPTSLNNVGWLGANQNSIHGGSFVPPTVSSSNNNMNSYAMVTTRPSNGISVVNTMPRSLGGRVVNELDLIRISGGPGRRRIKDDELSPEEREKRRVRRDRNKLAAAKCRQRRVDHTNTLVEETEDWEEKNATLEQEITKLQQQKEQLEFILEAHKAMCSHDTKSNKPCNQGKTTTTTSSSSTSTSLDTPITEVVTPTSVFNSLSSYEVLVAGETMDTSNGNAHANTNGINIKREPGSEPNLRSPGAKTTTLLQL
ncbi:uncharacterized protein [Amphiura filiformis]|uniref:uncharacterized protein isoform X2 n=1 Tax=Amphiura filiformis TaxID=82378 RepID=UPI003B21B983